LGHALSSDQFPEIVQFVRVGEEFSPQSTPLPWNDEFPVIAQFVISGHSPAPTAIPPWVPFVTVRFESEDPVRKSSTVPS
jgi:hypothetical protein